MNSLTKKIFSALTVVFLLINLTACGGAYVSGKSCYIDGFSPANKFITDKGTERYYCKEHVTKCSFCGAKATKNYTNGLNFHIFVCDDCFD